MITVSSILTAAHLRTVSPIKPWGAAWRKEISCYITLTYNTELVNAPSTGNPQQPWSQCRNRRMTWKCYPIKRISTAVFPPSLRHYYTHLQYINTQARNTARPLNITSPLEQTLQENTNWFHHSSRKEFISMLSWKEKSFKQSGSGGRIKIFEMIDVMNERWIAVFFAGVTLMVCDFSLEQGHIMS